MPAGTRALATEQEQGGRSREYLRTTSKNGAKWKPPSYRSLGYLGALFFLVNFDGYRVKHGIALVMNGRKKKIRLPLSCLASWSETCVLVGWAGLGPERS